MPKKVCIITGCYPARSETFVVEHVCGLARLGYKVSVVSLGVGDGMSLAEVEASDAAGVRRVNIKSYSRNRLKNLKQMFSRVIRKPKLILLVFLRGPWTLRELFIAEAYSEVVDELQPDVLHIHYGNKAGALCEIDLPLGAIITWHGYDANSLPCLRGQEMYHKLFAKPYRHTVGSKLMLDRLQELGCDLSQIDQIPMGVDLGKFVYVDRSGRDADIFQIVSVGRLDEMKGHRYLIAAVEQLISNGLLVRLRIVGEGPLRDELEVQIQESGLIDWVELLGARDSVDVRQELEAADLFVLAGVEAASGRVETQGVVLIEAQAAGLPVVTSNVGGVPSSLVDGETGVLCEPKNIGQIALAIQKYADNQELRLAHGRSASEFVAQRFSLATMLDDFEKIYAYDI